jgi:hypothetical protein
MGLVGWRFANITPPLSWVGSRGIAMIENRQEIGEQKTLECRYDLASL